MGRAIRYVALLLLGTSVPLTAHAQEQTSGKAGAGINLIWAIPQGAFGDHLDDPGVGVMLHFGGQAPGRPLALATELSFVRYGSDASLELARLGIRGGNIPVEALAVESRSNMAMGHLVGRVQPASGAFRPYLEALAGLRYFYTRTAVAGDFVLDLDDDFIELGGNDISIASKLDDWALSGGVGGGLDLRLLRFPTSWDGREASVFLNLGVRYLFGSEAAYVDDASLREVDGRFVFDVDETRTDLLVPQFGLTIEH